MNNSKFLARIEEIPFTVDCYIIDEIGKIKGCINKDIFFTDCWDGNDTVEECDYTYFWCYKKMFEKYKIR